MKISKITSEFNKGRFDIYLSGYDDNGKNVKKVEKFDDYFFYEAEHISDIDDCITADSLLNIFAPD